MSISTLIILALAAFSSAQWTPDPACPYPSDLETRYPYYGNCSLYWECYKGNKYMMHCPPELEFNVETAHCDQAKLANCDPYAPTTSSSFTESTSIETTSADDETTPTTHDPICPYPEPDEPVYIPYAGDCSKYWQCSDGLQYLHQCPSGLWWHQEIKQCDYPGSYCNNSTSIIPTTSTTPIYPTTSTAQSTTAGPTSSPYPTTSTTYSNPTTEFTTPTRPPTSVTTVAPKPHCPDGPSDDPVYFPYHLDCTKYWECSDGEPYLYNCPDGLWWHQEISQCDYPGDYCSMVECPLEPTPEPIFYPYDGDCTKYWECSDGIKYLYTCPSGLWWHQEISQCDYPGPFCNNSIIAYRRK